jgi:hypothetical protein
MSVHRLENLFTDEEIKLLNNSIENGNASTGSTNLGRTVIEFEVPYDIRNRLVYVVKEKFDSKLTAQSVTYVKYSNQYGQPNLPPHFDGDTNELIIDYQLSSNTSWDLGVNKEVYSLTDNSAIAFNPNLNIHWRPIKQFEDGEYVDLIFFRFANENQMSDYSHKRYSLDDPIYKEVVEFRNSLQ